MNKKVLIVSYTFPPKKGIGGRRWAKFSKYLIQNGVETHVICSRVATAENSFWNDDISKNVELHLIKFFGENIFHNPSPNFFQKVVFKLSMIFNRLFGRLNLLDPAELSGRTVRKKIKEVIRENNIDTVLVTGPPYSLFRHVARLKRKTKFKYVMDYRDMWNNHSFFTKIESRTKSQLAYSEHWEKMSIQLADEIICVDNTIQQDLIENHNADQKKISIIHNGFDPEDFYEPETKVNKVLKRHSFIFAGSISQDLDPLVEHFLKTLVELKNTNSELYNKFEFNFNCQASKQLENKLEKAKDDTLIFSNQFIPKNDYYRRLQYSSMGIVILSKDYSGAYITKFSDYLYSELPILQFGYQGDFATFLEKEQLGLRFGLDRTSSFFQELDNFLDLFEFKHDHLSSKFNLVETVHDVIKIIE